MEGKNTISGWIREHKKEIITTGVGIATIAGVVLIKRNWNTLCKLTVELPKSRTRNPLLPQMQNAIEDIPIQIELPEVQKITTSAVNSFTRNLPEGYHASVAKVATAAEKGFELLNNQTWVEPFTRTRAA